MIKSGETEKRMIDGQIGRRGVLVLAGAGLAMPWLNKIALGQGVTGTVRVWSFLSPEGSTPREVVLKSVIDAFTAANPGTSVVVEPQPAAEIETKYIAAEAQGRAPDVVWLRDTFLSVAADRQALADLDEALSQDFRDNAIPDLYPALAANSVFDGVRLSLPLWPSPSRFCSIAGTRLPRSVLARRRCIGRRSPRPRRS